MFKDAYFLDEVTSLAESTGTTIFLPSGAVGGLDVLQSAKAAGGLARVQLTTRKSPASLGMETEEEEVIFEGTAASRKPFDARKPENESSRGIEYFSRVAE